MKQIIVSDRDERRLRSLLAARQAANAAESAELLRLAGELDRARLLPVGKMPTDVVMLGSTVELEDLEDGEISTYTLVLPSEASVPEGRLSVLAPLGTGLLGYRVGDEFEWPVAGGAIRIRIRRLLPSNTSNLAVAS